MGIIHRIHTMVTTEGRPFSGATGIAFLSGTAASCDILIAFIGEAGGCPIYRAGLEAILSQLFFLTLSKRPAGAAPRALPPLR